jgi:hypothetical protein
MSYESHQNPHQNPHQNLQNLQVPIHEIETLWLPFGILAYRLRSARLLLLALCSMPIAILVSFGFMTLGDEDS